MTKEELIQKLHESAEEIDERVTYNGCYEELYGYMFDDIADMVKDSDLVEVVRCKDCIYSNGTLKYCSIDHWVNKDGTSFCSYGERRDEPVKHGKWIYGEDNLKTGTDGWFCSECKHFEAWDYSVDMKNAKLNLPNICPNCKAKMYEVKND